MEFGYYGIRTQELPFEAIGDWMTHQSRIWVDGEETDEELPGVCALDMRAYSTKDEAIEASRQYYGKYTAIIASDSMEYGEDLNEIILRDPVVIEIL